VSFEALRSAWRSLAGEGVRVTARLCVSRLADLAFDRRYGTDTYRWLEPAGFGLAAEQVAGAEYYKPSHAASLRKLLSRLDLGDDVVLLDIGCGKGRVLMVAAELGFAQARGIEYSPRLAAIAADNLKAFSRVRQTRTRFELLCEDVRDYRLRDDETLIYLFNPFGREATASVVRALEASLQRRPRRLQVVYRAPEHRELLDTSPCLLPVQGVVIDGQHYLVYRSHGDCRPADQL
jgi:predicted RNA methylase